MANENNNYSNISTHLGSALRNPSSNSGGNAAPEGSVIIQDPSSRNWSDLIRNANLGNVGGLYDKAYSGGGVEDRALSENAKFDIATALASKDLEDKVSGKDRSRQNYRALTEKYFRQLGGDTGRFNIDRAFGLGDDYTLFGDLNGIGNFYDNAMNKAGGAIDSLFDASVGNIVELFGGKEAGKKVKDKFSGEDLAWLPSTAIDIATWLLPGAAPIKIAGLLGKGVVENRQSLEQALSGKDQTTGEDLTGGQRMVNALAGAAGTALTALPGAGVLKGLERKTIKNASKNIDDAIKNITKGTAYENKSAGEIKAAFDAAEEAAKKAPKGAPEVPSIQGLTKKTADNLEKSIEARQALEPALNNLDNTLLPNSFRGNGLRYRDIFAKGAKDASEGGSSKSVNSAFANARKNTNDLVAKRTELTSASKDLAEKKANLKNLKEGTNEYSDLDKEIKAAEESIKKLESEIGEAGKGEGGLISDILGSIKNRQTAPGFGDSKYGIPLYAANAALQSSASLGSDSENIVYDLANQAMANPAAFLGTTALGLLGPLRNSRIRARNNTTPLTRYSLQADMLGKMIQDQNVASRVLDQNDLILLDLILSGNSPEEAAQILSTELKRRGTDQWGVKVSDNVVEESSEEGGEKDGSK